MDLRISETARQIGVTSATIRNWIKQFPDYLSSAAIQTTRKRFTSRDVATLKEINRLSREGYTWDEIPELLPSPGEVIEDPQPEPPEQTHDHQGNQENTNAITVLQDQIEQIKILVDVTIKSKDETIGILKDENQRLRDELDHQKKPWWKRF